MNPKKPTPIPQSLADVEGLMAQVAAADAATRKITAQMDAEITRVRERYATALDIEKAVREAAEEQIASWAELHKADFGDRRSMALTHGTIGWRLGNPAVKLRARVKAEQALEQVRQRLPEFVRTVEELDKAALLNAYAGKAITDGDLEACGLKVTQTERFYVEPKTEEEKE